MRLRHTLLALALVTTPALADYGPVFASRVTDVYDGDTFRVDIDAWPAVIGRDMPVRLRGVDTPERRSRCATEAQRVRERARAEAATTFTREALAEAEVITLHDIGRGSFFRLVAEVRLDGESLGERLAAAGHALPFGSGDWCAEEAR